MANLEVSGRILFLCADPAKIERQLAGEDLTPDEAGALRDDVSTDEITPISVLTRFDERLGQCPYVGFHAGGRNPSASMRARRPLSGDGRRAIATARVHRANIARSPNITRASGS